MKTTLSLLPSLLFIFFCAFLPISGIAGEIYPEKGCKDNPEIVDKCFTIHGRISIYNGTPSVRIWQVGSKRLFGVLPAENEIMPEKIKRHLTFGTDIYGDFFICPFTKAKTGHMQDVCVESASNIVVEQYIEGKEKPTVFKLKNNADEKKEKAEKIRINGEGHFPYFSNLKLAASVSDPELLETTRFPFARE